MSHFLFICCFIFACTQPSPEQERPREACFSAKVVGVKDGDTVEVLDAQNQTSVVRLAHIDCPERKQPFYQEAKQHLSSLCFNKRVLVCQTDRPDRNGRLIATLELDDHRICNFEMVQAGFAWHFKRYSDDKTYAEAEMNARTQSLGIWQSPNPIAPWDWRKGVR